MAEEKKLLPSRANRGNKMAKLLETAGNEEEDEFWGADYWKDDVEDREYSSNEEPVEEDVVDEDFDDPEAEVVEPLSDDENENKKRRATDDTKKKRKSVYVDPKLKPKKQKTETTEEQTREEQPESTTTTQNETTTTTTTTTTTSTPSTPKSRGPKTVTPSDRVIRASTLQKVQGAEEGRREREEEAKIKRRFRRKPKTHEVKPLTQRELLLEAKRTEEINKASLELLTRLEEEKKKLPSSRPIITGPMVRFLSDRSGQTTITWTEPNVSFPKELSSSADDGMNSMPVRSKCPITGYDAKYFDPKTKTPYATIEAFKQIRLLAQQGQPIYPTTNAATTTAPIPLHPPFPTVPFLAQMKT